MEEEEEEEEEKEEAALKGLSIYLKVRAEKDRR